MSCSGKKYRNKKDLKRSKKYCNESNENQVKVSHQILISAFVKKKTKRIAKHIFESQINLINSIFAIRFHLII